MAEKLEYRPHARLLTMLGEQLIKNDRVALVEIVKNSYDADATEVVVDFRDFSADFTPGAKAEIVVTDNGVGMTPTLVSTAWMNPATPSKALRKQGEPATTRGRVLQGEKGIGRFATFKLGSVVTLSTRAEGRDDESTLIVDISSLDATESPERPDLRPDYYLDEVPALFDVSEPRVFDGSEPVSSTHGTELRISKVRSAWSEKLVRDAYEDLDRLQPRMWAADGGPSVSADFAVRFLRDGRDLRLGEMRSEVFESALRRAVLKVVNGTFDEKAREFRFSLDGRLETLSVDDAAVRGMKPFKEHFLTPPGEKKPRPDLIPEFSCGSFDFGFFVFDLDRLAPAEHALDSDQRTQVLNHRIYLYRDGVRVYPYGDADDDWLEIDRERGTESARSYLSNDQTVGYVAITQAGNPRLRDKTSREGLVDDGAAVADFKALTKTFVRYLRKRYQPYLDSKLRARSFGKREEKIDGLIDQIGRFPGLPDAARVPLDRLNKALLAEREVYNSRVARTEQLAGVGLSVEAASHDLILAGAEALRAGRRVVSMLEMLDLRADPVYVAAKTLVRHLEFIESRFGDVQGLFVSTRQRPAEQDVMMFVRRVAAIYARLHRDNGIQFEIDLGSDLRARVTEAAILQVLINLVDNATYWLMASIQTPRIIRVFTPDRNTLAISDNGPGVAEADAPFIFEPFYSGKGETGKGLGLYIARQNGLREGFAVALEKLDDPRVLDGSTFVVRFGVAGG